MARFTDRTARINAGELELLSRLLGSDFVALAWRAYESCVETEKGSRVVTHCLYPSFEPVTVYVRKGSNSYRVHDDAGALRSIWDHGRDPKTIQKMAQRQAQLAIDELAQIPDSESKTMLVNVARLSVHRNH